MDVRPTKTGWRLALAGSGLLVLLAASPSLMPEAPGAVVRHLFSPVCHQLPDRSPHAFGEAFALCHRCWGILLGFVAGIAVAPGMAPRLLQALDARGLPVLALALAPTAADWLLAVTGVWANTPASRTLTGAVFGAAAGMLVATATTRRGHPTTPPAPSSSNLLT